jgi:hypothetical protein
MASGQEPLRWLGRWALLAVAIACGGLAVLGYWLGDNYIPRLSNHSGYHLVQAGQGKPELEPRTQPRRVVVVVVDGLRADYARKMKSARRLDEAGACLPMSVGRLTVSRPIYAILSTGLEADRTGARNNDETSPLAAESIWKSAREAGKVVNGASSLRYWQELFPVAFDRYVVEESSKLNIFEQVELGDVTLIHVIYPDSAGHDHGAASKQYREAVERTDLELSGLLDGLDLSRDLVVLTADHGHVDRGGHGGPQASISKVWTCFAGPAIASSGTPKRFDARTFAPTLAVLMGVAFPGNMRAGDDQLDSIWRLVDEDALGRDYVEARKKEITRMRAANATAIEGWSADGISSWTDFYQRERLRQLLRMGMTIAIIVMLWLLALIVGYRRISRVALHGAWMVGLLAASGAVYVLMRGSFDFTSINLRSIFVASSSIAILGTAVLAVALHLFMVRSTRSLAFDLLVVAALVVAAGFGHRLVYGVPLGFPLPGRYELFFPFMAAAWALVLGFLGTVVALLAAIRER